MAECQRAVSSREYAEWMAFARHEPIGAQRGDLQAAMICMLVANVNRGKGQRPFRVQEFLPEYWPHSAEPDWQRQLAMVEMLNAAMGGDDLREQKEG